jgi:hypothetical protein
MPVKKKVMFNQLINLVKENAGDEIIRNPAIPDQRNDEAISDVTDEIDKGLEHEGKQGNVQNLVSLFKGNTSSGLTGNPMIKSIISNVTSRIASKFGVSGPQASQIAAGIVPKVLNGLINKTNDPNDRDFDLQDVLKKYTGNSNIGDLIGQFTGGNKGGLGESIGGFFKDKK